MKRPVRILILMCAGGSNDGTGAFFIWMTYAVGASEWSSQVLQSELIISLRKSSLCFPECPSQRQGKPELCCHPRRYRF